MFNGLRNLVLAAILGIGGATPATAMTVVSAEQVLYNEFGVNLHLGSAELGDYTDIPTVIAQIQYIGAHRLRDWMSARDNQLAVWRTVHAATRLSFHASIPETAPQYQRSSLALTESTLKSDPGLIDTIEGGNEEDDPLPHGYGATLADTALLQSDVFAVGRAAHVAVDELSVGAGWYPPLYEGDYKVFGKPPADFGNGHAYMNPNSPPMISLTRITNLASYAVDGRPVDVTEFGVYRKALQSDDLTSAFMSEAPFDAFALGDVGLFVYALHDDASGAIGFYDAAGRKRAFADYWHFTTALLADPGGRSLPPKDLPLTFSGTATGSSPLGLHNLPMYKSDGSLWIAAYDEERNGAPDSTETIGLDHAYAKVTVFDARNGQVIANYAQIASLTLPLPINHVYLVDAR